MLDTPIPFTAGAYLRAFLELTSVSNFERGLRIRRDFCLREKLHDLVSVRIKIKFDVVLQFVQKLTYYSEREN